MVLHLEAGSCVSDIVADDVDDIARDCYQSRHYTSDDPVYDFCCPGCECPFSYMSGVLQHAESDACDVNLGKNTALGKFLHYLRQRI
jgi:hypothetical protein